MAMDDYITDSERTKRKKLPKTRLIIEGQIKPAVGNLDITKLTHKRVKSWRDALATTPNTYMGMPCKFLFSYT
jgi:hypothetical protein